MNILLFANAPLPTSPLPLPPHDLMIAADGGARRAFKYGLVPEIVIGDLDSLTSDEVAGFDRAGASIYRFPADKDETDLELALNFAVDLKATKITCYGMFGGRWDMTFANVLLLADPRYAGIKLEIVQGDTRMHILRAGETLSLQGRPGDIVSVLSLDGPAGGVTYDGLVWPLEDAVLPFGSPRGVSNTMKSGSATVSIKSGVVLVTHSPPEA